MTYKFSPTICEYCGLNRTLHNALQKQKCSDARKAAHENDKRPRNNKKAFYDESTINYLSRTK